jgi:putative peptidoglycan lipid II flippase
MGRLLPMTLGIGIYTIDLVIARRFLSELPEGAQSYFSWAMRLCDFPQGIFVLALQAATLPSLAKLVAAGELEEVGKTYAYGMRLALFVAIPATALLAGLARPIVVTLFQRGPYFDATSSTQTAHALLAQGLGIWTVAAVRQLVAVYYALGDTRTPVLVSALDLLAFIGMAVWLRGPWGHVGVSAAVAVSSAVQMLLLWVWLGKRMQSLHLGEIGRSAVRTIVASLAALASGLLIVELAARFGPHGAIGRAIPGLLGAAVFVVAFFGVARLLKSPELVAVATPLGRLVRRKGRR